MVRWTTVVGALLVAAVLVALLAAQTGLLATVLGTGEYEQTTLQAVEANGSELAIVTVRVADTHTKRYVGLSNTAALGPDEGMVFVYDESGTRAFVMRNMSFALDIIYVAGNGSVTRIHHASVPPAGTSEGELRRYRGRGQYVLETNRGWANETGLTVGDQITGLP
jgi:uncharacterized membrane protein (UPF0127 family)